MVIAIPPETILALEAAPISSSSCARSKNSFPITIVSAVSQERTFVLTYAPVSMSMKTTFKVQSTGALHAHEAARCKVAAQPPLLVAAGTFEEALWASAARIRLRRIPASSEVIVMNISNRRVGTILYQTEDYLFMITSIAKTAARLNHTEQRFLNTRQIGICSKWEKDANIIQIRILQSSV
jgi:hypothetical protein